MGPTIFIPLVTTLATINLAFTPLHNQEEIVRPVIAQNEAVQVTTQNTPTPTPAYTTYVTKSGDTLTTIARAEYGSQKHWVAVWNDNENIEDPAVLHAGTELKIRTSTPPADEETKRELPTPTPTVAPTESLQPTQAVAQTTPAERALGAPGSFAQTYIDAGGKFGIPWQILHAIHMVETGQRDGPIGGGGGPQGPMQFMPGTWAVHGIDGNGDGVADINNAVDAIYSAANYLSKYPSLEQGIDAYGRIKTDVFNIARGLGYNP